MRWSANAVHPARTPPSASARARVSSAVALTVIAVVDACLAAAAAMIDITTAPQSTRTRAAPWSFGLRLERRSFIAY